MVHLGYNAGTSLKIDSMDLISKPSTILGFNIFLVLVERSAKDIDEVIALAAKKKYRAVVGKTLPMCQVAEQVTRATGQHTRSSSVSTIRSRALPLKRGSRRVRIRMSRAKHAAGLNRR
jgi:NADPH:quinone reductase-like Zn-dependent oxidoreductase